MRSSTQSLAIALTFLTIVGCDGETTALDAGPTPADAYVMPVDAAPFDAPVTIPDGGRYEVGDASMPAEVPGCEGATFLSVLDEPEARGPWAVGVRTVRVGRLDVEVWYPAAAGSEAGATRAVYDVRQWLPPSQQPVIPDADNPWQPCECARDLPIDDAHGPYPVIAFVHGTAAFRTQSLSMMTHWASRGFVVVAADHPGLFLGDSLATLGGCPDEPTGARDLEGDVRAVLAAVSASSGDLAFLATRIDATRVGLAGHSAGGVVASLTDLPGVRVIASLASSGPAIASATLESSLFVAAASDRVVPYMSSLDAYAGSPSPRRFLGITNSGHLAPSDLCDLTNTADQNLIAVANRYRICGAALGRALFDCRAEYIDHEVARTAVDAITTAVFEEVLLCRDRSAAIAAIPTRLMSIEELRED